MRISSDFREDSVRHSVVNCQRFGHVASYHADGRATAGFTDAPGTGFVQRGFYITTLLNHGEMLDAHLKDCAFFWP